MTQEQIQELLRDKARLDWLADPDNPNGNVILPRAIVERNLHSLRDAIDETMAAPPATCSIAAPPDPPQTPPCPDEIPENPQANRS